MSTSFPQPCVGSVLCQGWFKDPSNKIQKKTWYFAWSAHMLKSRSGRPRLTHDQMWELRGRNYYTYMWQVSNNYITCEYHLKAEAVLIGDSFYTGIYLVVCHTILALVSRPIPLISRFQHVLTGHFIAKYHVFLYFVTWVFKSALAENTANTGLGEARRHWSGLAAKF